MISQTNTGYAPPTVACKRVDSYEPQNVSTAVNTLLELLGGLDNFIDKGDTVLIKPNFITARPREMCVQTDPAVIIALATILKDFGAKPFVGDSPAWGSIQTCVNALELAEPLRKLGVPVKDLNKSRRHCLDGSMISISQIASDADKIINLPKFKAHQQLGATFAVKNMFGCVSGKRKAFFHFSRGKSYEAFCTMLIEIYKLLSPVLSIIDGVTVMEGQGPIRGRPKKLGFLVAGADPVACEIICSDLINLSSDQLPIVQTARKMNFGCSDLSKITVVGDDYADYKCTDFKFAELVPLDFSLARVSRSICKQLAFRLRSIFGRGPNDKCPSSR